MKKYIFAVLAIGLAYSACILGLRPLNPADLGWLKGDLLEHHLAWLFYGQTPGWSFPLTWSQRAGYPVGGYLSLMDPALLLTLGWFRSLLPAQFQYLGLFYAANACLQFHWGTRLGWRLCGGDRWAALASGALFLMSPIMTQKGLGHFSGGCHWPMLAGLYFLLAPPGQPRPILPWLGLTALSAVIHPYLGATLCAMAWVAGLRWLWERHAAAAAAIALAAPLSLAASLYAIGILSVGGGAAAGGFQEYSLNLVGLVNPAPYPSLLPMAMGVRPLQDFEGYAYLGLGVLVLLAIQLPGLPARLRRCDGGRLVAGAVLTAGCLLVAFSNRITFGAQVLFEYPLPPQMDFLTSAFRAPARFGWPAYYLLMGLSVAGLRRRWPLLLAAAVLLQFLDLAGLRAEVRQTHAKPSRDPAIWHEWNAAWPGPDEVWTRLGALHLAVLPAWQCGGGDSPGGEPGYAIFGRVALAQGMTVNEYRASRYAPDSLAVHCRDIPAEVAAARLRTDTAYVLNDALFLTVMSAGPLRSHGCRRVDGYILCLPGGVTEDWQSVVRPLETGQSLTFSKGGSGLGLLSSQWLRAEDWGVWSGAAEASLRLPLAGPADLDITLRPLLGPDRPVQEVRLLGNGRELARWSLDWTAEQTAHRVQVGGGVVELRLAVAETTSPSRLGYAGDDRPIGVGLVSIRIAPLSQ